MIRAYSVAIVLVAAGCAATQTMGGTPTASHDMMPMR